MVALRSTVPFTEKEYLALEAVAETKHEFVGGAIIAMAGAEFNHVRITGNVTTALNNAYAGRPCTAQPTDLRIKVEAATEYFYPDVSVVCGEPKLVDPAPSSLLNPTVIVEVLSPSTERHDRVDKWFACQTIPTLTDYVLIASDCRRVEHFSRRVGQTWPPPRMLEPNEKLVLSDGTAIDVDAIYRLVSF